MDNILNYVYVIKVWLLTILVGPVLTFLFYLVYKPAPILDALKITPLFFLFMILGFVFSIPAFLLYLLIFRMLQLFTVNILVKKVLLVSIGISFIAISFFILDAEFFAKRDLSSFAWPASYCLALVVFTFILKWPISSNVIKEQ